MVATAKPYAVKNRLLAALPHEEYKRLQPHLELVHLSTRRTLSEAGDLIRHAYFLNSGMGSLLALTQGGATVEIAMVGNEHLERRRRNRSRCRPFSPSALTG
jgi:CRP-like cAMP-binding protein